MKQHMNIYPPIGTKECDKYNPDYTISFRRIIQQKGEYYTGKNDTYYNIVFILEGELEFSYGSYLKRHVKKGEILFIVPETEIFAQSIADTLILVLIFDNEIRSVCDNCALYNYAIDVYDIKPDFYTLQMTPQIQMFADVVLNYIETKTQCKYLNELKQKELFVIFPHNYALKELRAFFYPVLGHKTSFRTQVLKAAQSISTVQEIAQHLGMSKRNFSRKFSEEFGEPARFWLLKQKAKYIKLKLLVPGTTISDIMQEYKFTDLSHFTKFCKEHFGSTPTELIKKIREEKL